MSYLDRIIEANRHDYRNFLPFVIAGRRYGCVKHAFAERLMQWRDVFQVRDGALRLAAELEQPRTPAAVRTEALASVCRRLHRDGVIKHWREELYPVTHAWNAPPVLLLERAAVPFFGVTAYGVHMNGYVRDASGKLRMWVGRRTQSKPTGPGKLDQLVAGGQPFDIGLRDNMIKECREEAGIPLEIAQRVRAAGAISYVLETDDGLRPDVIFSFDLELSQDFEPCNLDGEVDRFYCWDIEHVQHMVASSAEFKFNCALVVIDYLVRHGLIGAEHRDYEAIVLGLRADLDAVPHGWPRRC